jgi:hypothetical protein
MQTIELYIEGQRVELFKDESVSLTQSIQNAKDPAKIFTDFSKSFTIPASKVNNKIFKHYYNFDIVGGFDARIKVPANIELNSLQFRKGFIQLNGVDLKNNKADIYRITFFGETVNLKDLVGEDNLSALGWLNNFNLDYDAATVENYLKNVNDKTVAGVTYSNPIVAPLITHTDRLYYDGGESEANTGNLRYHNGGGANLHGVSYNQLKYSIRLHLIIKAIEQEYGITFSSDFFSDANPTWHNLYMWMHRKKGDVIPAAQITSFDKLVTGWVVTDGFNLNVINPSTVQFYSLVDFFGTIFELTLDRANTIPYNISILRDGFQVYSESNITLVRKVINVKPFARTESQYQVVLTYSTPITFTRIEWYFEARNDDEDRYVINNFEATADFEFIITQQLPEIKVIDFLTGIFRMFNLTAYVEDDIIVVKELDSFYSSGTSYDITKYIDVNKSSVDVALPYKQIDFEYADYKTFLAAQFNQLNGQQFGELKYKGEDNGNFVGGIYKVTLPFQKILYERLTNLDNNTLTTIQYGFFVDDNQQSYIGKPLIHYVNRQTGGTTISFRTTPTTHVPLASYYIPLNQNGLTSVQSLHFGSEVNEYALVTNEESLFKNFYLNYIQDIFEQKRRIIKLTAYLPLRILLNYNLSDTFIIGGVSYKINSITTNLENGKSELELLNEV